MNCIEHVEAVEAVTRAGAVLPAERIAEKRRAEGFIETPGSAEIVLGAGAADGREFRVAVKEHLDLALAPPAVVVLLPGHITADEVAAPFNAIENRVVVAVPERIRPVEPGVEICVSGRLVELFEVDRVKEAVDSLVRQQVLHRDFRVAGKRHREVAVHAVGRIHIDRNGDDLRRMQTGVAEEVAERNFDARSLFPVPVHPKHDVPQMLFVHRNPDMPDAAGAVDIHQRRNRRRRERDARTHLPLLPELARATVVAPPLPDADHLGLRRIADLGHAASPGLAVDIFSRNRTRTGCRNLREGIE